MVDKQEVRAPRSTIGAMLGHLRTLATLCDGLLLDRRKGFIFLSLLVLVVAIAESIGIALIQPLVAAIQGQVEGLAPWLARLRIPEDQNPVIAVAMLVAVAFVFKNLVALVRIRWSLLFLNGLWQRWVRLIVDNIVHAPMDTEGEGRSGALLATALSETRQSVRALTGLLELLVSAFTLSGIYAVLLLTSWRVALALPPLIVLLALFGFRPLARAAHRAGAQRVKSLQLASASFLEILAGVRYIKAFGREELFAERMTDALSGVRRATISAQWLANFLRPLIEASVVVLFCLIAIVAAGQREAGLAGRLPVIGVFGAAMMRLIPILTGIGRQWVSVISKVPAMRSVLQALKALPRETGGRLAFDTLKRGISFSNVNYSYPNRPAALVDVSLDIERGHRIALVGESGSGKSTVISLLLGFIQPQSGPIEVDGVNLEELRLASWRSSIGYVGQEGFLFETSLAENLSLGRVANDDPRIREVGRIVGLDEFVETLPGGYSTLVGERGTRLSGGQRQRVSLARAILMRPEILVLDEAMNALDNESTSNVMRAIGEFLPGATWLVVGHRLNTTVTFDSIFVLRRGRVFESGGHAELMRSRGYYYKLFETENGSEANP